MSIRPIEPGCLAVVHGLVNDTEFNGLEVSVDDVILPGEEMHDRHGQWHVYMDDMPSWICSRPEWKGVEPFGAKNLLRIDDHGEDADDYEVIREEWGITA